MSQIGYRASMDFKENLSLKSALSTYLHSDFPLPTAGTSRVVVLC